MTALAIVLAVLCGALLAIVVVLINNRYTIQPDFEWVVIDGIIFYDASKVSIKMSDDGTCAVSKAGTAQLRRMPDNREVIQ